MKTPFELHFLAKMAKWNNEVWVFNTDVHAHLTCLEQNYDVVGSLLKY